MKSILTIYIILVSIFAANAQTTSFTYQGKLNDNSLPANGNYEFQFKIFDRLNPGGPQIGGITQTVNATVTNGIFTVELDFGAATFSGEGRFLEISVRRNVSESFITLSPRQFITSSPYAIKARNAETAVTAQDTLNLGGIAANQYVQTNDTRMTDDRNPLSGSPNYIQNGTTLQSLSNFNISNEGKAGMFTAARQYNIGANRVLSNFGTANIFIGEGTGITGNNNAFVGTNAGQSNTTGFKNSYFGANTGRSATTAKFGSFFGNEAGLNNNADNNSFFGASAGWSNTTGTDNTFIGFVAGFSNTTGIENTMVGIRAGQNNTTGKWNTIVGMQAGFNNTTGVNNSFFGTFSGGSNTTGERNTFVGFNSGRANTVGVWNVFVGADTGLENTSGERNTFVGTFSGVKNTTGTSNSFFGLDAGNLNTTGSSNSFVGVGAGKSNLTGSNNSIFGTLAGFSNTNDSNSIFGTFAGYNNTASNNSFFGESAGINTTTGGLNTFFGQATGAANITGQGNTLIGAFANVASGNLSNATAIGAGAIVSSSNTILLGRGDGSDKVQIPGLGSAGSTQLCRNASNEISTCSSSRRYKTNINDFGSGLSIVNRLRPVTFNWIADNKPDLGLVAEEVAEADENLIIRNEKGEVEGVKYDRVGAVLVNAVKEQQVQIESQEKQNQQLKKQVEMQQKQLDEQKKELELLKQVICSQNPGTSFCKEKKDENK